MRKSGVKANDNRVEEAMAEWRALTEVRYELAREAYDFQDDKTKALIDRIVRRLREGASGYITIRLNPPHGQAVPVKVDQEYLGFNLLYVATEILKDLAMFDIKVGTYKLPPSLCVNCGAELTNEKPKKARR